MKEVIDEESRRDTLTKSQYQNSSVKEGQQFFEQDIMAPKKTEQFHPASQREQNILKKMSSTPKPNQSIELHKSKYVFDWNFFINELENEDDYCIMSIL